MTRFIRFRTDAFPTFFGAMTVKRLSPAFFKVDEKIKWSVSAFFRQRTFRKSLFLIRSLRVKVYVMSRGRLCIAGRGVLCGSLPNPRPCQFCQTASCFLPLARLLRITSLPEAVFILTRKPCVLFRLLLCGWYVLFIIPPQFDSRYYLNI